MVVTTPHKSLNVECLTPGVLLDNDFMNFECLILPGCAGGKRVRGIGEGNAGIP